MLAGKDRRSTWTGDALSVRCWIFDWVNEGGPDFIVGCRVSGARPGELNKSHIIRLCRLKYCFYTRDGIQN